MKNSFLLVAMIIVGCGPKAPSKTPVYTTSYISKLRDKESQGACAERIFIDELSTVKSCIQVGSPGSLYDDPNVVYLVNHIEAFSIDSAKPDKFQVKVTKNGQEILKKVPKSGSIPNYTSYPKALWDQWYDTSVHTLKGGKPKLSDVYVITMTVTYDTSSTNSSTITFEVEQPSSQ